MDGFRIRIAKARSSSLIYRKERIVTKVCLLWDSN